MQMVTSNSDVILIVEFIKKGVELVETCCVLHCYCLNLPLQFHFQKKLLKLSLTCASWPLVVFKTF